MTGAIEIIALQRAIEDSAEIETQLSRGAKVGMRPVFVMLAKAKRQAADAMVKLACIEPHETEKIRALQNEIHRLDDLVIWTRDILVKGKEADKLLQEADREDVVALVAGDETEPDLTE